MVTLCLAVQPGLSWRARGLLLGGGRGALSRFQHSQSVGGSRHWALRTCGSRGPPRVSIPCPAWWLLVSNSRRLSRFWGQRGRSEDSWATSTPCPCLPAAPHPSPLLWLEATGWLAGCWASLGCTEGSGWLGAKKGTKECQGNTATERGSTFVHTVGRSQLSHAGEFGLDPPTQAVFHPG